MISDIASFGAGCFWGVESAFRCIPGVTKTSVGYMGGHFPNPSYLDVCARITGHAEVVQVEFCQSQILYEDLLEIFWAIHDPTSINRQGADRGEQYRSVLFCHNNSQLAIAKRSKSRLQNSGIYDKPIFTKIEPASDYYLAADEHQHYFEKAGKPLPEKLRSKLPEQYQHLTI